MGNLTFKKRGITESSNKSLFVQKMKGKHFIKIQRQFGSMLNYKIHADNKPKEFSLRNWVYPLIFAKELEPLKVWEDFCSIYKNPTIEVTVEISHSLQNLAMCFDTPHFKSCGSLYSSLPDLYKTKANDNILLPNVFCIFTRDRRGLINNRMICEHRNNIIKAYSFYGNDTYLEETFTSLLAKVSNLKIITGGSFI